MGALQDRTAKLNEAIVDLQLPWHLPLHLLYRIGALIGEDSPVYADTNIEGTGAGVFRGRMLIFTPTRVLQATAENAASDLHPGLPSTFTVDVVTWSRRSLLTIAIGADATAGSNPDDRWGAPPEMGWPEDARLTLRYDGRPPLTLPLAESIGKEQAKRLMAFVPSLLDDVASTSS